MSVLSNEGVNEDSNISSRGINKKGVLRNAIIDYQ
ncbi:hypothetical protein PARMER_01356 [Parabacteroides merdae ATCC 43184]|nr:hypothetical protein PARMER_01356 [Parabacteroides merdae ATCC 43184]